MERQLLSYLPPDNVKVARERLEEYDGRFVSTMFTRNDIAAAYSHRFGLDWIQAFQSFHSLQPFQVQAAFNGGWGFNPVAGGQLGSPGIVGLYGAGLHRQQMNPLNREMVKMESRKSPKRSRDSEIVRIGGDEANASIARERKGRTAFARWQVCELETAFLSGHYPDPIRRQELSARLRIDEPRLQVWFQNRRARWRRMENTRKGPGRPSLRQPPSTCSGVPITRQELEMRRRARTDKRKRVDVQPDALSNTTQPEVDINRESERENGKREVSRELCNLEWKAEVKTETCDSGLWATNDDEEVENTSHNLIDFRRCSTPTDPTNKDTYAALSFFSDSRSPDDQNKALHKRPSEQFYPITTSDNQTNRPSINRGSHAKLTFSIDSILAR